ncbi:MAG: hemerythrin domain-containing protein [Kiloniellales bacterium]|nr:hemerythrin domain-containing protein [Kiloniellales bacterium]
MAAHSEFVEIDGKDLGPNDFLAPIDFILAEHYRQRLLCEGLAKLTESMELAPVAALATRLRTFLDRDLRLHLEDEEKDLFPLLWQRAKPEDNVKDILDLLSDEHGRDEDLVDFLLEDLALLAGGAQLANPIRFLVNVREFAETQRRHLAWENALLLPVARRRLTEVDLAGLARSMAARRGIDLGLGG